jgi:DNA ligase (NAD+)
MKDITINDLKALVSELNEATDNYDVGCPIMTDAEWDDKYYTLIEWERILNTILPNSPTIRINSKISDKLEKVEHNHPMLSLSKTKDLSVFSFNNK